MTEPAQIEPGKATAEPSCRVWLDRFSSASFDRGATWLTEAAWIAFSGMFVSSWIPGSTWRVALLRMFGASIGTGVVIKPRTRIKFPWRLTIGDHSWIGESAWIDNLAKVTIGSHVCISQQAYIGTGSHDWSSGTFDLVVRPVIVQDFAWIAARATIAPGARIGRGSVVGMAALARGDIADWTVQPAGKSSVERNIRRS